MDNMEEAHKKGIVNITEHLQQELKLYEEKLKEKLIKLYKSQNEDKEYSEYVKRRVEKALYAVYMEQIRCTYVLDVIREGRLTLDEMAELVLKTLHITKGEVGVCDDFLQLKYISRTLIMANWEVEGIRGSRNKPKVVYVFSDRIRV